MQKMHDERRAFAKARTFDTHRIAQILHVNVSDEGFNRSEQKAWLDTHIMVDCPPRPRKVRAPRKKK